MSKTFTWFCSGQWPYYKIGEEEEKIFDTGVLLIDALNPQGKVVYMEDEAK